MLREQTSSMKCSQTWTKSSTGEAKERVENWRRLCVGFGVFRSSDVKATGVPWSFKIEHVQPGMKSFYFSASSEREMIRWMSAIKIEMLAANNLRSEQRRCDFYSPSDESLSSWGSSEYNSLECEIYNKGSTEKARQSILSEVLSNEDCFDSDSEVPTIYESPVPCEPSSESLVPNFTAMPVINEEKGGDANTGDNSQKDDGGNMNKESSDYWASIHFQGSKVEASEVINGIAFNGVYLVRKSEDGQSVLQVYADDMSRKYRIFHREDGQVTLSIANGPNFDSLEDLLFHYYSKTLPNSSHYLTVPYKLHPEFIYNERH
ncbi:Sh3 domain-binding protein 2-like [Plakobranchus ocellatus]|uniref:Sh3 domain-binding protein 2-like n=1 Tax=Plakobranchus ocellatus TaxID=259542 RepID=A0AAV4B6U8_9GAST|nr:Sh3 domain-binding protein 2-like [Plakobranchus ocellatus]